MVFLRGSKRVRKTALGVFHTARHLKGFPNVRFWMNRFRMALGLTILRLGKAYQRCIVTVVNVLHSLNLIQADNLVFDRD